MACASCHSSAAHHTAALRCMHFLAHVRAGWMATFHRNFASETYIAPSIFRTTCDAGLHLAMYLRHNSCICMCELLPLRMAPLRLTACVVLACTLMHAPCMAAARGHLCHTSHAQQDSHLQHDSHVYMHTCITATMCPCTHSSTCSSAGTPFIAHVHARQQYIHTCIT